MKKIHLSDEFKFHFLSCGWVLAACCLWLAGSAEANTASITRRTTAPGTAVTATNNVTTLTTSAVVPAPAAGNTLLLAVAINEVSSNPVTVSSVPAGYTAVGGTPVDNASQQRVYLYAKKAVAGEPAAAAVTISQSAQFALTLLEYAGVNGATPIDAAVTAGNIGPSTSKTPSVTAASAASAANEEGVVILAHNARAGFTLGTAGWTMLSGVSTSGKTGNSNVTLRVGDSNSALSTSSAATASGTLDSARSWTALIVALKPGVSVPPPPTGLTAEAGDGQVTLNWNASEGATSYKVRRSTVSGGSYTTIASGVTTASYLDTTVTNGTTYYYMVRAVNSAGTSGNSNQASATPAAAGPALPEPPRAYTPPAPVNATSTAEFIQLFTAGGTPRDIVIKNGTYEHTSYVAAGAAHRIWAETCGGVTLKFGLELGQAGCEVHGIKFNISNISYTYLGNPEYPEVRSAVFIWKPDVKVQDCWVYGNLVLEGGIFTRATSGFVVQRCIVNGFRDYGVFFETYYPDYENDNPAVPPVVEDCDITAIYHPVRGSNDGKSEAGLWAGTRCTVNRIKVTDTGWMGIWTGGNCNDAVFSDLTIDNIYTSNPGIGIYMEHKTRRATFQRFQIGPVSGSPTVSGHYMKVGIVTEWNYGIDGNGACTDATIRDGVINSSYRGVATEDAEKVLQGTLISNVKFLNQSFSCIKEFRTGDLPGSNDYNTIYENQGNDFTGRLPSAVIYSRAH